MVNYNWKRPDLLYLDVIEYFDGKVNNILTTLIDGVHNDNQNQIKKYIENKVPSFLIFGPPTAMNMMMDVTFENKNYWLLCDGCIENSPMVIPSAYFYTNENSEEDLSYNVCLEILEECKTTLLHKNNMVKICNSCNENAMYTCKQCDNVDFCEECHLKNKYEKVHLKKLDPKKITCLCDICGRHKPIYGNDDNYCLCQLCFENNPHRNHQLTKIEKVSNLLSDEEAIRALKKSLYYHYALQILQKFGKNKSWDLFEQNGICCIFNNDNSDVKECINNMKPQIKNQILGELKEIELEFSVLCDKMIRKFYVLEFRFFNFFVKNANYILLFSANANVNKFYKNGIKMIKLRQQKKEIKHEIDPDNMLITL